MLVLGFFTLSVNTNSVFECSLFMTKILFVCLGSTSAPLLNIEVNGIESRFIDTADLQGVSGSISSITATLQSVGKEA